MTEKKIINLNDKTMAKINGLIAVVSKQSGDKPEDLVITFD